MNLVLSTNEDIKQINVSLHRQSGNTSTFNQLSLTGGGTEAIPVLASFAAMVLGATCMLCFVGKLLSKWYTNDRGYDPPDTTTSRLSVPLIELSSSYTPRNSCHSQHKSKQPQAAGFETNAGTQGFELLKYANWYYLNMQTNYHNGICIY